MQLDINCSNIMMDSLTYLCAIFRHHFLFKAGAKETKDSWVAEIRKLLVEQLNSVKGTRKSLVGSGKSFKLHFS